MRDFHQNNFFIFFFFLSNFLKKKIFCQKEKQFFGNFLRKNRDDFKFFCEIHFFKKEISKKKNNFL